MTEEVKGNMVPLKDQLMTYKTLQVLAQTPTVPERYFGKPDDLLAAVLYGRELGLPPMQSIHTIFLVDGRASMEGKAMAALVFAAGHELRTKVSPTGAKVAAFRRDPFTNELHEMGEVEFTHEDAVRAKLDGKQTYKQYPMAMLGWRAITMACRLFFSDVLAGVGYTPEEIGVDEDVQPLMDSAIVVTSEEMEMDMYPEGLTADDIVDGDILDAEVAADAK